jgi:hypothetical protein
LKWTDTGVAVEAKRWYRITFRWDHGAKPSRVDILVDGNALREGVEFPRPEGVYGFRWSTTCEGAGASDPCAFLLDNLKAMEIPR